MLFVNSQVTFFCNFLFHYKIWMFLQQIEIFNVISIINFGKLPIAIGYKMKSKLKLLGWETILIKNLQEFQLPLNIRREIIGKEKDKFSSMNIILGQELNSCNKLITIVRDSMVSLKEAMNGLNVMSSDVENTFHHVKTNMVLNKYKVWEN